jgi:hypothetical protein
VIHRVALAARLEIEGRTALVAELGVRWIAVGAEMTARTWHDETENGEVAERGD